ncbi:hypothetical protein B0H34DRAFT_659703 [Crassisporium funariophilum]|nr:hypothetical protein B0H34DRAFT_659703 [Crassisporium funariophilum]
MCGAILEEKAMLPHSAYPRHWRRRSADVGGLHLATENSGQGQGWMGGSSDQVETIFAELLSDMYTETLNSVNDNSLDSVPADLPESVRSRLIWSLDRWHFEPHLLPDEEVLACTLILFETLFRVEGMQDVIPLTMQQITSFIHHLRRIYRYENTYHNFEHALDVLQASQSYLKSAGMIPSPTILFEPNRLFKPKKAFDNGSLITSLGLRELFALYVAAIGHDVGHPGFTNGFMKNAKTPLSLVFDHTSALEQMHCQLLLRVMKHHGLGVLLDDPKHGSHFRKILWQSVLATDMGVHEAFMQRFKKLIDGESASLCYRQVTVCQAILKNADISNPTRPFLVSKHWANALMQEWTAQAHLEEEYQLQQTVMSSDDPLKEAESQIFFIGRFAKPLLELTVRAVPEMNMYHTHCKLNLQTWNKRKIELIKENASVVTTRQNSPLSSPPPLSASSSISPLSPPIPNSPRQSDSYLTAFPLTLPTYQPKGDESVHPYPPSSTTRSSDHESQPESPSECESVTSSMFSPISDTSSSRYPSTTSSTGNGHIQTQAQRNTKSHLLNVPNNHAAIRNASKMGSIGKQQQLKKKLSRNSWCATSTTSTLSTGLAAMFHSPPSPTSTSSSTSSPAIPALTKSNVDSMSPPSELTTTPVNSQDPTPPPSNGAFLMKRSITLQVSP